MSRVIPSFSGIITNATGSLTSATSMTVTASPFTMATDDHHADGEPPYPDDLRAGQLLAADENRNRSRRTGESGTPHAGGEISAGGERHFPAGTGGAGE